MFYYGGESNVPGAPGNLMAGSPGYFMPESVIQDRLFRYGMDNTESGRQMKERIQQLRQKMPQGTNFQLQADLPGAVGNLGALAQVNPTYPPGDPRYGQPMMQGGVPMSLSEDEFSWSQRMNQLRQKDPSSYEKVKGMMGPQGWMSPPPGFNVPPGI
jgi:hypothetical protein